MRGFTLLEVMIAATVLLFVIVTAITTLQSGLKAVDNARNYTVAAQIMQNEMEQLRLKSWAQLETLQLSGNNAVTVAVQKNSGGVPFACTRTISDLKAEMKEITLVSTWRSYDGRSLTAKLVTRYSKTGLYDYFYAAR